MNRLRVAPIVEGHGECECVRKLLERIWFELLDGEYVNVLRPIREKRHRLVKPDILRKAVTLAQAKLASTPSADPALVLVLLDADKDVPCVLGPQLLAVAQSVRTDADVTCIVANVEYESWFVAAANSLTKYLEFPVEAAAPWAPETARAGKGWVERHFRGAGRRYSETQDQPAMTAEMDLVLCRSRAPSFDKLCREMERRRITE